MSEGIQDDPRYRKVMDEAEAIEAPCDPDRYRVLTRIAANPANHVAVGFGGGSLPGLAGNCALAVLLEELDLRRHVREVWGTSAGSIAATGFSVGTGGAEILALADRLRGRRAVDVPLFDVLIRGVLRFLRSGEVPDGFVRGRRFFETIEAGLKVRTFEECDPPCFIITCTDDGLARKVVHREGPLLDAIAASMCIPGIMEPVPDWNGEPWGYLDGGVVEKTPLPSIIEHHARSGRDESLVVLCTHFDAHGRVQRPRGFVRRFLHTLDRLEDDVWEAQLQRARETPGCKAVVLNPGLISPGMFDFEVLRFNYLWSRRAFKEQLSNAHLAGRFLAR